MIINQLISKNQMTCLANILMMVNCKSNNLTLKIGLVPILYQDNSPPPHKWNKGAFSYASIYLKLLSRPFFCLNFYLQVDHHHSCTWHLFDATNGRP